MAAAMALGGRCRRGKEYMAPSVKLQVTPSSELKASVMACARRLRRGCGAGWGGAGIGVSVCGAAEQADMRIRCKHRWGRPALWCCR